MTIAAAVAGLAVAGFAQEKKKEWKDRTEYELYEAMTKATDPNARLAALDKWSKDYPTSDFATDRLSVYLGTYQQLQRPKDVFATAKEILKADPLNLGALSAMAVAVYQIVPPEPQYLADAETSITTILGNLDKLYAADKKPQQITPEQWEKGKGEMNTFAQRTMGWVLMQKKDNPKAEEAFTKSLTLEPNNAQVSAWLGTVMIAQRGEKISPALFHFARAGHFEGQGAVEPAARKSYQDYFNRVYKQFHGSEKGADEVIAAAKASAMPPAGFKIESQKEIIEREAANEEEFKKSNPMMFLWRNMQKELTGENGQNYFDSGMKDALLPGGVEGVKQFRGKLVSATPETNPKTLVVSIGGGDAGDATLNLDEPLRGKMEPGGEIGFEGVAKSFTKDPFMVTFEVERAKVTGWAGVGGGPGPKKTPPAGKKPAGVKKK
ncbi:MAG: hypothetical protein K2X35_06685 [Bryobacteraceae bacterium]|nr:hypothetical protein [Bryobacteraceae bacterium]